MSSMVTRKQKKYIKKYIHLKNIYEIAEDLHIQEVTISDYLIEKWGTEKYEEFKKGKIQKNLSKKEENSIDIIDFSSIKEFIKKNLFPFLLLFSFVCFVYVNALSNGFVSDDIASIAKNDTIHNISYLYQHPTVFLRVFTIYAINKVFGLAPIAFRMVNVIFHIGSVWLLFILLYKMTKKMNFAFIASSFFAVHPILVESITWISGGAYVQSGFFILLSLLLYSLSSQNKKIYVFSIISFLCALLFSEKSMAYPAILVLYELCFGDLKKNWMRLIPFFSFSLFYILYYIFQIGTRVDTLYLAYKDAKGYYNPFLQVPIALISYIILLFFPDKLTLYHSELVFSNFKNFTIIVACICLFAWTLYNFKKNKFIFFWLSLFIISLAPTLTPFKVSWIVAERYVYIGSIGIIAVLTFFLYKIIENKKWQTFGYILFYILLILLSARTIYRNTDWKNEDTLWISMAKTSPSDPKTHNNLGDYYARHNDLINAEREFKTAILLNSSYYDGYHNLGSTYWRMKKYDLAILNWKKALSLNPAIWQSHHSLAAAYVQKKEYKIAVQYMLKSISLNPKYTNLYSDLGVIYERIGKKKEAIAMYVKALQLDPNNITAKSRYSVLR